MLRVLGVRGFGLVCAAWFAMSGGCRAPDATAPRVSALPLPSTATLPSPKVEAWRSTAAPPAPELTPIATLSATAVSDLASAEDAGTDEPAAVGDPPHPENDLAYPCRIDADCRLGACFVSGRGPDANPICSKLCSTDAECPDGARCTAPLFCAAGQACDEPGHCFRACANDDECAAFNAHQDNPVVCVSWAPIPDFLDPGPPVAAIDICIQYSEP